MNRILIVARTSYAGMGPYVSEIVNLFTKEHDNIYYFFRDYNDDYYRKNIKQELHPHSYFYKRANSSFNTLVDLCRNTEPYYKDVLRICKDKKINVVHFINGIPHKSFVKKLKKEGIALIGTVHDLQAHEAKKAWYKMVRRHIIASRQIEDLKDCVNLITNSPHQYQELVTAYPSKNIMYHAFPSLVTPSIIKGNVPVNELDCIEKPYILFFGRIEEYKGTHLLYEAFLSNKGLSDKYNLVIAGSGKIYFDRQQDESKVIFINRYIRDEEVASLYKNACCVVYPYLSATQSGVLSLAFYFQCPTLASDVPFFESIISDTGVGLLFKKNDINDLIGKLQKLLTSDLHKMTSLQHEFYNKNYEADSIRNALIDIYNKVQ